MFAPPIKAPEATTASQAPSAHASKPLRHLTAGTPAECQPQAADPDRVGSRASVQSTSWDFSKIPLLAPNRPSGPEARATLLQRKLAVGQVDDPLEHEADRVAEQVMRMPEPALQRKCACGGACPRCKSGGSHLGPAAAPPIIHEALRSSGQLLDSATRAYFEPRFGHDFGDVRVHSDALAAQSADAVHALAFTVGQDIVFAAGRYRPETPGGRRLLAHELTHVVQQAGQTTGAQPQLEVAPPGDRFEQEAERVAEAIAGAGPALGQRIEGVMGPSDVDPEEESLAQPLSGAGPLPGGLSSIGFLGRRRLQRAASFKAGKVHVARNAAVQIATGGVAGVTLPVLNGKIFKNAAGAQAAIKAPTIARRSTATGAECWIKAVPTNTGSFDETVLTSGPWTTTTTRSNAWDRLGVAECLVANPGNARLTAKGDRTDADVAAANRTHEDRHATDDEKVFNAVVVPWDTAMTKAQSSRRVFSGADASACDTALYAAMGGTPDTIATKLWDDVDAAGHAFHKTAAGAQLRAFDPWANADCSTATVRVKQ